MDVQAQYQEGMTAYRAGRFAQAIVLLSPLAGEGGGATAVLSRFCLGQAHYQLALQLYEQGQFRQAASYFRVAAQLNPQGGGFTRYLAGCYAGSGRFDLASFEYERLLAQQPQDLELRVRLALSQWKEGQTLTAMTTLREGIRSQPQAAELHYQLGVMLAGDDEYAEAEKLFTRALQLAPKHLLAMEHLAQCCAATQRPERALYHLQRAAELDPTNARIGWQLSLLSGDMVADEPVRKPRWPTAATEPLLDETALARLGQAVAEEPDFVEAFLSLPESEIDTEVFSSLAAVLERALAEHPEFADLHYHCGQVYRRMGQAEQAIQHAEQAVQLNPRYVNCLILLARLYRQMGQESCALERLKQALDAGGDYPDVHCLLGQVWLHRGESQQAKQAYARALALNGDHREAREAIAALAD